MATLSYSEVQEFVNNSHLEQYPKLNISILRNIVVETIEPYWRYFAIKMGFNAQVKFGEYDNVFQEAVGGMGNVLNKDTDVVMVFLKMDTISYDLANNYTALSVEQVHLEVKRIKEYIAAVLAGIRRQTDAFLLWHCFDLPTYPAYGIWDSQTSDGQLETLRELNRFLLSIIGSHTNTYCVDLNLCIARIGANNFFDPRYWHIGRAPFASAALYEIASENFKFIRARKGKNKKCIVLDCDNILWGGIVGEDGFAGVKLGKTYPGSAYCEFQQEVLNLYHRGVIIAICSKNNEDDVMEIFRNHPDMVLKEKHITNFKVNWQDKATNIRQIAKDLNIGLDSMVFFDDSEFEANLVREIVPEVEVIHMPPQKAVEYRNMLASCGFFDTLTITAEDKKRGLMYKAEVARKDLQKQSIDIQSYYKSLEMKLEICYADTFSIPRIAQLTQKTNQFNLTSVRYSESDINRLADSDDSDVMYVKLEDRFGDYGIVGVAILKHFADFFEIDTFLLSCRVTGRGVEDAFLVECMKLSGKRNKRAVRGRYIKSKKNQQVADFYKAHGFEVLEVKSDDTLYQFDLSKPYPDCPWYFKDNNVRL